MIVRTFANGGNLVSGFNSFNMSGPLILFKHPDKILEAATKGYVDTTLATHSTDAFAHLTTDQNTFLDGISISASEVNYLSGTTSSVQTQLNSKLPLTGGTMTGAIVLAANPLQALHPATKQYVDSADALSVAKAGDTMSGALTLSGAPTADLHASTKKYVDDKDAAQATYINNQDALKVAKAGDTMTGPLTLSGAPTDILHATTKHYVDGLATTHSGDATLHLTSAQNTLLDSIDSTATEINYLTGVTSSVQTQINSKLNTAGGTMTGSLTLPSNPTLALQATTKQYVDAADALSVAKSGDTMSGFLTLSAAPTSDLHASTKKYVDDVNTSQATYINTQDALRVSKAGDTMTGALTLSADPVNLLHAATKQYVDSSASTHASDASLHLTTAQNTFIDGITISSTEVNYLSGVTSSVQTQVNSKLPLAGGTLTGALTLPSNPTLALQATTKQYVDAADALKIAKAGDTMTGLLTLSADPTSALHAATKQYVDGIGSSGSTHASDATLHLTSGQNTFLDAVTVTAAEVNYLSGVTSSVQTQLSARLPLAGGTMTGAIVLAANPTLALQAAPKQYVDSAVSTHSSDAALHLTSGQNTFLDAVTATAAEVNYSAGVTSAIQTQLNARLPLAGGTMTGAITLAANPTLALQAAPKQYVDSVNTTLSTHAADAALHLTSGQNTFLDAVTVSAAEVNYLAGVTSAVQTQLNSKLALAGGTMTGALTLSGAPTANLHAATKQYVDTLDVIKVGGTIRTFNNTVPSGYLYCNGAYVNKTTYANLFTALGTLFDDVDQYSIINYTKYTTLAEGKPWINQYDLNSFTANELYNTIQSGTGIPAALSKSQAVVTKNRVYLLGGYNGSAYVATVYTAPINADGTLGTWTTGTNLPGVLGDSQAVVTKNRVYLMGGWNGSASVTTVYTAPINTDGTLGTWTTGNALPGVLSRSQALVTKNRVYLLGGWTTASVATVYSAPIDSTGVIGTWVTGTSLPGVLSNSSVTVIQNKVYLIGGYTNTAVATVYTSTIAADGTLGAWSTGTSIPAAKYAGLVVSTQGNIFYLGGYNNSTVYKGALSATGDITGWTTVTGINQVLGYSSGIMIRDKIYFLANYLSTSVSANVYYISFTNSGINDYSLFYDGTLNTFVDDYILGVKKIGTLGAPSATVFGLPDYTYGEANHSYTYIKI